MFGKRRKPSVHLGQSRKVKLTSSMEEDEILYWIIQIKQHSHYTTLYFNEVTLTSAIVTAMLDLFRCTSRYGRIFDKLHLEFCDGYGIDLIVTAALLMDGIKQLFIAMEEPNDDIIQRITTTLQVNTSLLSLWLLIPITETSAIALSDAIKQNENLERLSLSGSNFDKMEDDDDDEEKDKTKSDTASFDSGDISLFNPIDSAILLAEGLNMNTSLHTIDLSCCYLNDDALAILVSSLVGHPSLQTLDVTRNAARTKTIHAIADLLQNESTQSLTCLNLNEQIEDDEDALLDISALSKAIRNNRTIDTLRLSNNNLTDKQVIDLVDSLQGNDIIQELDLQYNRITEIGLNHLTKHLSGMSNLAVLLLGGNAFGSDGQNLLEHLQNDDDSICTVSENDMNKLKSSNTQRTTFAGFASGFTGFSGFMSSRSANSKMKKVVEED